MRAGRRVGPAHGSVVQVGGLVYLVYHAWTNAGDGSHLMSDGRHVLVWRVARAASRLVPAFSLLACAEMVGLDPWPSDGAGGSGATGADSSSSGPVAGGSGGGGSGGAGGFAPGCSDVPWAVQYGDAGKGKFFDVAVEPTTGNILAVAEYDGTIPVPDDMLTTGGADAFIAEIGPSGQTLRAQHFGDDDTQRFDSIVVPQEGRYFVAGTSASGFNLGGQEVPAMGNTDAFVAMLDNEFVATSVSSLGGTAHDHSVDLALTPEGHVLLVGAYASSDFEDLPDAPIDAEAIFFARFDEGGSRLDLESIEGGLDQSPAAVTTDASGLPIVAGRFATTLDLAPFRDLYGAEDPFVVSLDESGDPTSAMAFLSNGDYAAAANDVAVLPGGDLVVVGRFAGNLNVGGTILGATNDGIDIFVARVQRDGPAVWAEAYGSTGADEALAVAVGPDDSILVGGMIFDDIDFGGGSLASDGGNDLFLAAFAQEGGGHLWSRRWGDDNGLQAISAIAVHPCGVVIAGSNGGFLDFGTGPFGPGPSSVRPFVALLPNPPP